MIKKWQSLFFVMLVIFGVTSSGCALFLVGAGAAGGYAISKDEIEGMSDSSFDKVWRATKEAVTTEGVITLEDKDHGHLEGVVEKASVKARLEQVTPKTVRLRIKARRTKGLFPDIRTAQKLYTLTIRKLEGKL